jgi:ribonuclease HI
MRTENRELLHKRFHIDGAGSRPDGTGSGFAWVRLDRDEERVRWMDGLTNNQAEYRGLIAVLKYLLPSSSAWIHTDSQLVCEQFNDRWAVHDPDLRVLLQKARDLIESKELSVQVRWIPREENLAGKLLDRTPSRCRNEKTA